MVDLLPLLCACLYQSDFSFCNFHISSCIFPFLFREVPLTFLVKPMLNSFSFCLSDFPGGSDGKASACNAGDLGSIPGLGMSPGEGNGNPLQYSCLENSKDRGDWQAIVHAVTKSQTWLNDLHFHFTFTSLVPGPVMSIFMLLENIPMNTQKKCNKERWPH